MTLELLEQKIAETTAQLKLLKKLRRIELKKAELAKQIKG